MTAFDMELCSILMQKKYIDLKYYNLLNIMLNINIQPFIADSSIWNQTRTVCSTEYMVMT